MLIVYSGKTKHKFFERTKLFLGGIFMCSVTLYVLYVSAIYNTVIATSNTEVIINWVAILFIMEIDEMLYSILERIGVAKCIMSKDDGNGEENELEMRSLIANQADQINAQADQIDALENLNRSQASEMEQRITGLKKQNRQEIQSLAESIRQLQPDQGLDSSRELV